MCLLNAAGSLLSLGSAPSPLTPHLTHTHTRLQISPLSGHRYLFSFLSGFGVVPMGCVLRRKVFFCLFAILTRMCC